MLIRVEIEIGAEGVAVVLSISAPSVIGVVETLPHLCGLTEVAEVISSVSLDNTRASAIKLFEVVADNAVNFSAVKKEDELGFNTSVKVLLDLRCFIAVHFDMSEFASGCQILVIALDLGTHGVPCSREIDASVSRSHLVETLNDIVDRVHRLWHHIVLAGDRAHGSGSES